MDISQGQSVDTMEKEENYSLSDLMTDFSKLKLEESKRINSTFKTMSKNAHGFLQRTTHQKTSYVQRNLITILEDLHKIYLDDKNDFCLNPELKNEQQNYNESKFDDKEFDKHLTGYVNEGSFKSLNLSLRKDSCQQSLIGGYTYKDNISLKGNENFSVGNMLKNNFHKNSNYIFLFI